MGFGVCHLQIMLNAGRIIIDAQYLSKPHLAPLATGGAALILFCRFPQADIRRSAVPAYIGG